MQRLDPNESLYLAPNNSTTSRLSPLEVIETVAKIFAFLGLAYDLPLTLEKRYPFNLASCTTMDAMLTQLKPLAHATVGILLPPLSLILKPFLGGAKGALGALKSAGAGAGADVGGPVTGAGTGSASTFAPGDGDSSPATGGAGDADAAGGPETGDGADADNAPPETSETQDDPEPIAAATEVAEDGGVVTAEPEQQPEDPKEPGLKPGGAKGGRNSRTTTPTPSTGRTSTGIVPKSPRPGADPPRRPSRTLSQMGTPSRQATRQPTNK